MAESNGNRGVRTPLPKGRPVALPRVPDAPRYSMDDLVQATGIPARTIRYYITEGMLTPAYGRGPSATYDKDHMLRLRMIEELKDQHLQLREIKAKLQKLSLEDLEAHFSITSGPNEAMWKRISIHSDVELHVQVHDERDYAFDSAIQQIVQYARFVLDQGEETT